MTDPDSMRNDSQPDLFETEATRSLLDRLLTDSKLYTKSKDYMELLAFVARMRNFAPFNAMLLQVQKPGLRFAASAHRCGTRRIKTLLRCAMRPKMSLNQCACREDASTILTVCAARRWCLGIDGVSCTW